MDKFPTRDELLKEHEFCQNTASSMEETIWRTGAAMSLGYVGSLLVLATKDTGKQPEGEIVLGVGVVLSLMSLIWWLAARRWWSVQHSMFIRMRHIERRLGFHANWYIQYIDHFDELEGTMRNSGLSGKEIKEIEDWSKGKYWTQIRRHQHWGVQASFWWLPPLLSGSWLIYGYYLLNA